MSRFGAERFVVELAAMFDKEPSPETIASYVKRLSEFEDQDLAAALETTVRRCRFFPSLSECFDIIAEIREQRAEREKQSRLMLPAADQPRSGPPASVRETLQRMGFMRTDRDDGGPLTRAERRHNVHVAQEDFHPEFCRFCKELVSDVR